MSRKSEQIIENIDAYLRGLKACGKEPEKIVITAAQFDELRKANHPIAMVGRHKGITVQVGRA